MNHEVVREKIQEVLQGVSGMGKVFPWWRHKSDWKAFLEQFAIPHPKDNSRKLVCLCMFQPRAFLESDSGYGLRAEDSSLLFAGEDHRYLIRLLYGYSDDENTPSEFGFESLVRGIQSAFRGLDKLGLPDEVEKSHPVTVPIMDHRLFGDVLCHFAEMELRIEGRTMA